MLRTIPKFHLIVLVLGAFVLALGGIAQARGGKGGPGGKGGMGGHGACKADRAQFCADVEPGQGRVMECLQANEASLSQACQERVQRAGDRMAKAKAACGDDIERFCADKKTRRDIRQCLVSHQDELSDSCGAFAKERRGKRGEGMHGGRGGKGGMGMGGGRGGGRGGALRAACGDDMQSLCPDARGREEMRACMDTNREALSQSCRTELETVEQRFAEAVAACGDDVERFCPGTTEPRAMRRCLRQNKGELSDSCRTFRKEQRQGRRGGQSGPLLDACRSDIQAICPDVEHGQGRVKACLKENRDRISTGCQEVLGR